MDQVIAIGLLLATYIAVYFTDFMLKSCMHHPYHDFLSRTGLSVKFFRLRLYTTSLNRVIFRFANRSASMRNFLAKSYTVGVIVSFCLLPLSLILVVVTILNTSSSGLGVLTENNAALVDNKKTDAQSNLHMELLVPGMNLPLEDISYYVAAMICAAVVHELGHGLAAAVEDVPTTGFGFQFLFILPLAYTHLSPKHLNALNWLHKLRIYCAGIWHNCLCAAFSYLILCSLGYLCAPLYTVNEQVIVTAVQKTSPLTAGNRGLMFNDVITHINNCRVIDKQTWYACLLQAQKQKPNYCVSSDFIRLNDESVEISQHHDAQGILQCCDARNEQLCCFEYIDDLNNDAPVEIPQHVCLHVRRTLTEAEGYCGANGKCESGFCLRPLLHNRTTIMNFKRLNEDLGEVIYIGQPRDVVLSVQVSGFVPKGDLLAPEWGDILLQFLQYNTICNIGLALINVIPCFGFDGYYLVKIIIHGFLSKRVAERPKRDFIATIVTGFGSVLCVLAFAKMLWMSSDRFFTKSDFNVNSKASV